MDDDALKEDWPLRMLQGNKPKLNVQEDKKEDWPVKVMESRRAHTSVPPTKMQ